MERIKEGAKALWPHKAYSTNTQRKAKEGLFNSHLPLGQCQEIPAAGFYNVSKSHDCVGDFQL